MEEFRALSDTVTVLGCVGWISRVVLDFEAVEHINFRGVALLEANGRFFRNFGGDLRIAAPTPYVRKILLTRSRAWPVDVAVYATVAAAIES